MGTTTRKGIQSACRPLLAYLRLVLGYQVCREPSKEFFPAPFDFSQLRQYFACISDYVDGLENSVQHFRGLVLKHPQVAE